MPVPPDVTQLESALPGRWVVKATNFPMWLGSDRRDPVFEYELRHRDPLALHDVVHYTDSAGTAKTIVGTDKWSGSDFVWRGRGLLGLLASHWTVTFLEQDVLALQFEKSMATPSGADIAVREGVDIPELRTHVAADPARFGLSLEQFASLTWLDHLPPH